MDMSPLLHVLCCEKSSCTSCCMKCQDGWWGIRRIHGWCCCQKHGQGRQIHIQKMFPFLWGQGQLSPSITEGVIGLHQGAGWCPRGIVPTEDPLLISAVGKLDIQQEYCSCWGGAGRGKSVLSSPCVSLCWHSNVVYVVSRSKKKRKKALPNTGPFSLDLPKQVKMCRMWRQVPWSAAACLSQRRGYFVIL